MKAGGLSHHPAPHADRLPTWLAWLMFATGPLAWFIQLCVGVAMTSWSCFPRDERWRAPARGYTVGALAILILCAVIATVAAFLSWRKLAEVKDEKGGDHEHLADTGHGRTRFMALWGVILGCGFAVATLVTLAAFLMLSPCAG